MSTHPVSTLRNIVLLGHGSVGKTSLADLILYKAGVSKRLGSPEDGTSFLDIDEEEKQLHHSVTSHLCHFEHKGARINLFDAPGMPDFVGQVVGAMRAAETAVITVDAPNGVEIDTRKSFQHAGQRGLARMIVINKCDCDAGHLVNVIESIRDHFGAACVPINIPLVSGEEFSGVVSAVNPPEAPPEGAVTDVQAAHRQLMDAAVETDEELMMRYLEDEPISSEERDTAVAKAVAAGTLIPIFCTCVKSDVGVAELMDAIAQYAPSPADLPRHVMKNGEDDITVEPDPSGPLVAQVVKTRIDPYISRMSYLRIYSGTLKRDSQVHIVQSDQNIKIGQLIDVQGGEHDQIDEAGPGEIVAVVKIEDLHTGNTLTDGSDDIVMPPMAFPRPMIGLAVEPKSQADQAKITDSLHKIEEEDPTFVVHHEEETHELVMEGMSELHLQLIQNRLHNRDKVDVVTHEPKIPYRETVTGEAEGMYRHKKQSGGSGQFAEVHMKLTPCPRDIDPEEYFTKERFEGMREYHYDPDINFGFVDRISGGSIPNQFIPAVEKGLREQLAQGVLAGFPVQDVVVELFFGKYHSVDSNETAFKIAARSCFRELFEKAKPSLLEPVVSLEVTVPSGAIGDITGDLSTRRGRMENMEEIPGGFTVIHASAPLAELMTYARGLSGITGGQGSFTMEFNHYEPVPGQEQKRVIEQTNAEKELAGSGS
jgi:elongation factor G